MLTHSDTPSNCRPDTAVGRVVPVAESGRTRQLLRLTAPIHPILVHFTIALTTSSLGFDALAFLLRLNALRSIGWWLLAAAILITLGTLGTGVRSRLRLPVEEGEMRSFLRAHMAIGPIFFGLLLASGIWRGSLWQAGAGVTSGYLIGMIGVVLVMAVQGYLGGELVYRYGAEVKFRYRKLPERIVPPSRQPRSLTQNPAAPNR
jgi:uncharacterized membrane protein